MKGRSPFILRFALASVLFVGAELLLIAFADKPISQYLREIDARHPALIDAFRAYTDLGKSCWYLWPSGIAFLLCLALSRWQKIPAIMRGILRRAAPMLAFFFACVALSGIVTDIIKPILGRARPVVLDRQGFYGFDLFSFRPAHDSFNSMPSGHATTAFAVAFALIALGSRARPWLIAFAVAIAFSRVMVNAHFLSDVLAGSVVGILTVAALQTPFRRRGWLARQPAAEIFCVPKGKSPK